MSRIRKLERPPVYTTVIAACFVVTATHELDAPEPDGSLEDFISRRGSVVAGARRGMDTLGFAGPGAAQERAA